MMIVHTKLLSHEAALLWAKLHEGVHSLCSSFRIRKEMGMRNVWGNKGESLEHGT